MKKSVAFCFGLFALLALPSVSLAAEAPSGTPPAMSIEQLSQAIFAQAEQPQADVTPSDFEFGIPEWIYTNHCNPDLPCANQICECNHSCACGVARVTCSPYWICECNPC